MSEAASVGAVADRERLLAANGPEPVRVETPEWPGGHVYVRAVTPAEQDAFELENSRRRESGEPVNLRARYAVLVVCDAKGRPVFRPSDADALGRSPCLRAVERVVRAARRLNSLDEDDVREAEKNSGPTPPAGS